MSPTRLLLFGALGLGGLLVFAGTAKASTSDTPPHPDEGPKPAPAPPSVPTGVPGACLEVFNRWKGLASQAVVACARAAELADEWWVWEEYRLNGEFSYDPAYHEQIRRDWQAAQASCENINGASIQAMHDYEACVG